MFAPSNTNAAASSNNTNANFEKAVGFVNLYLPSNDGGRVKLGKGIALRASNKREKALFDALMDPTKKEAVLKAIIKNMTLDFQTADQSDAKGFDLGGLVL